MAENNSTLRRCCVCHEHKPTSLFGPHKKNADGLQYECRPCVLAKVKAYMAAGGDEYKRKKREYDKARNEKHKAAIAADRKIYYEKNRATKILRAKEWEMKNPDRARAIKQNYKHKRRAQEASGITYSELMNWKAAQVKVCHWCGTDCQHEFVVDHVHPLSKGGKHEVDNLVISCRSCNARKSNKMPDEFLRQVARNTVCPEMLQ